VGRPCLVCHSPKRERVDVELVGGEPVGAIAKRYRLSPDSIRRHKAAHLSPALTRVAVEHLRDASAGVAFESTVDRIESLIERLENLLTVAEERRSLIGASNLARELRQCLELVARLRGELDDRPQVAVNILASPEVGRLVATVIAALEPYPAARVAVADRLEAIDVKELAS
jgi:hypothetical protein